MEREENIFKNNTINKIVYNIIIQKIIFFIEIAKDFTQAHV